MRLAVRFRTLNEPQTSGLTTSVCTADHTQRTPSNISECSNIAGVDPLGCSINAILLFIELRVAAPPLLVPCVSIHSLEVLMDPRRLLR